MYAVENVNIYIRLCKRCYRGKHGEPQGEVATGLYTALGGIGGLNGERHIAVVWLYSACESRVRTVTFEPQPPIEKRNAQTLLFSRESYFLLIRSRQ